MNDQKLENLSDIYFERLSQTTNPGGVLARFLCEILELDITKAHIIMMNKLIRVFGKYTVFFSVLDIYSYSETPTRLYPSLYRACQRRFESAHGASMLTPLESLDRAVQAIGKEISKVKKAKLKMPDPSVLEKN